VAAAGRDFAHLETDEVAATAQLHEGRACSCAEPRPRRGLDRVEIDRDALDDRNALPPDPIQIEFDQVTNVAGSFKSVTVFF
jgi:hypothetical protein